MTRMRIRNSTPFAWLFGVCLAACATLAGAELREDLGPVASIIIDDVGYNLPWGERAVDLPGQITYAVLPHTPNARGLARRAYEAGKEVILHAPMENLRGHDLGPGALTQAMTEGELVAELVWGLAAIPYCRGINNHMGSLLTQRSEPMRWIMAELKRQRLYFVDSRTTPDTIAWKMAREYEVPYAMRDVFLDHDRDPEAIGRAFDQLLRLANRQGTALAIGHPYPETVDFLERNLHRLLAEGIRLVPASVLARRTWHVERVLAER